MNILVVDSNKETAELLCEFVQGIGHKCSAATNNESALEHLKKNQYDLALLEIDMPDKEGYEIIHELGKGGKIHDNSIIVFTTSDSISMQQEEDLKSKGVKYFFAKPVTIDSLLNAINPIPKAGNIV